MIKIFDKKIFVYSNTYTNTHTNKHTYTHTHKLQSHLQIYYELINYDPPAKCNARTL